MYKACFGKGKVCINNNVQLHTAKSRLYDHKYVEVRSAFLLQKIKKGGEKMFIQTDKNSQYLYDIKGCREKDKVL